MMRPVLIALLVVLVLGACDRQAPPAASTDPADGAAGPAAAGAPGPAAPLQLSDQVETTSDYVVGISYPDVANRYPGLALEMKRYADAARSDLMEAVEARGDSPDNAMYDLSLSFTEVVETPEIVAVAADGSTFTGGAHGNPLLARFVWLPRQQRLLEVTDLIEDPVGWQALSVHVREQLHTALSQRVDADRLEPAERAEVVRNASRLIEEGTQPDPGNFDQFEPVVDAGGKITALRFVFAPYQVGPYSDGVQSVQVPASLLLPHIAPVYRDLFATS